jgi:hypothetical protein
MVTNSHRGSRCWSGESGNDAERQVGQREMTRLGNREPGLERRHCVVGLLVEYFLPVCITTMQLSIPELDGYFSLRSSKPAAKENEDRIRSWRSRATLQRKIVNSEQFRCWHKPFRLDGGMATDGGRSIFLAAAEVGEHSTYISRIDVPAEILPPLADKKRTLPSTGPFAKCSGQATK